MYQKLQQALGTSTIILLLFGALFWKVPVAIAIAGSIYGIVIMTTGDIVTYQIDPDKLIEVTRVYYEDGMYETMNWDTLPQDGVLLVVVIRKDGSRRTLPIKDYYFQAKGLNDEIFGSTDDLRDILRYPTPVVLFGKWTDDATFEATRLKAME